MINSRRNSLPDADLPTRSEHAGLWLERYIPQLPENREVGPQAEHFRSTAAISVTPLYRAFFDGRWRQSLAHLGAECRVAEVQGRMVVGMGEESVLENSITLHHTYGVPLIPGSALKGLAARYARARLKDDTWRADGEAYEILFGTTERAGYVTFFDALFVPGTGKGTGGLPLLPDVMTVHHREYYEGKGQAPADYDDPTPIPFLSATGKYLVPIAGPEWWRKAAFSILEMALKEEGIGAKTSSGYGRMILEEGNH